MFVGVNLTSISDVDQDKYMFVSPACACNVLFLKSSE